MGIAQKLARLDGAARPSLSAMVPTAVFAALYSAARHPMLRLLARERVVVQSSFHPVEFVGLRFRSDLGNAAGFDKDGELLALNYQMGAGFAVVGTVLIEPHNGNSFGPFPINPWTPLTYSHGALNSLGLPNVGVDVVVRNIARFKADYKPVDFPIGVSIMGHPAHEGEKKLQGTVECLRRVLPFADFVEINESCPNVHDDSADLSDRLRKLVDSRNAYFALSGRYVPLFVKLGTFGDVEHMVRFMTEHVDGLVGVNTQKNYDELRTKLDPRDVKMFNYYTKAHGGGVSGAPIGDFAFEQIESAAREIKAQRSHLKLIHVGGIRTQKDIARSRQLGDVVPLREWYTGMMEAMTLSFENVYDVVR